MELEIRVRSLSTELMWCWNLVVEHDSTNDCLASASILVDGSRFVSGQV